MRTLLRWVKFIWIKESNPIKGREYFSTIQWFRADIRVAREEHDWRRLWQYRCIFLVPLFVFLLDSFRFWTKFDQFDSYLKMDIVSWADANKQIYLGLPGFALLNAYFLHVLYFSPDTDYYMHWQRRLILNQKSIRYHWPFHYKSRDCSYLIRKVFYSIVYFYQLGIFALGKF